MAILSLLELTAILAHSVSNGLYFYGANPIQRASASLDLRDAAVMHSHGFRPGTHGNGHYRKLVAELPDCVASSASGLCLRNARVSATAALSPDI